MIDYAPYEYYYEMHHQKPMIIEEEFTPKEARQLLRNMISHYAEMTERELARPSTKRDMLVLLWLMNKLQEAEEDDDIVHVEDEK